LFEFQIAKNNRLMVYRQTIKQDIASADDGQSLKSFKNSVAPRNVGGKKLIIKPSSLSMAAAAGGNDGDTNNNEVNRTDNSAVCSENMDSSNKLSSVDDSKSIGETASSEYCGNEMARSTDSREIVVENDTDESVQQIATASTTQKGRKTGKKSTTTGGRKGNYIKTYLYIYL